VIPEAEESPPEEPGGDSERTLSTVAVSPRESAEFPTEVKEVLAMFGPKTYGNDLVPSRLTVGFRAAAAANPITVV
jgi:hypothetical protein